MALINNHNERMFAIPGNGTRLFPNPRLDVVQTVLNVSAAN